MFVPLVLPESLVALSGSGEGRRPGSVQTAANGRQLGRVELFRVLLTVAQNGLLLDNLRPEAVNGDVLRHLRLWFARFGATLRLVLQLAGRLNPAFREDVVKAGGARLSLSGRKLQLKKAQGDGQQGQDFAKNGHFLLVNLTIKLLEKPISKDVRTVKKVKLV